MITCPHCQHQFDPQPQWTMEEVVAMAEHPTVGLRRSDAEAWWAHYASVDFVDAAGRKITNLRAALIKWKISQPSHGRAGGTDHSGTGSKVIYAQQQQLEALQADISEFTARNPHPDRWPQEKVQWMQAARARVKELRKAMGGV